MLLPPDLDELMDANHPVRIINAVVDSLDIDAIIKTHKGRGSDKVEQYNHQEQILDDRNSYSKTDHDATFMRMKLTRAQKQPTRQPKAA